MEKENGFVTKLVARQQRIKSCLCVGLDPKRERIPETFKAYGIPTAQSIYDFMINVVDRTAEFACAFKPNIWFYFRNRPMAISALNRIVAYIRKNYPDIPIILDFKCGDIGKTAFEAADGAYAYMHVDAVTANPYCGVDSVSEFCNTDGKFAFVICKTTNRSSVDFQDIVCNDGSPLYMRVARKVAAWDENEFPNKLGLVAGATFPADIGRIVTASGKMPLLIPGIGAQGGDVEDMLKYAAAERATNRPLVINSSSGISNPQDITPHDAAAALTHMINSHLPKNFYE